MTRDAGKPAAPGGTSDPAPGEAPGGGGLALLEVRGVVKDYPGVRALDGVDFAVAAGQVHCLVGQNGAGKSTLIKCVAGLVTPSAGEVLVDGEPLPPGDPAAALARGVATIYQELDLVDDLTVADNLFLGHELRRGPLLDRTAWATAPAPRRSAPVRWWGRCPRRPSRSCRSPGRSPARPGC
jgi:ABC-type branched-subunit amino acid transport system ATPase component